MEQPMQRLSTARLKIDAPASQIIFLVAVPLFLGIALSSGGPLVQLPEVPGLSGLASRLSFPDFTFPRHITFYSTAIALAVVAALETVLCLWERPSASSPTRRHAADPRARGPRGRQFPT
jgi:hypothetical protein